METTWPPSLLPFNSVIYLYIVIVAERVDINNISVRYRFRHEASSSSLYVRLKGTGFAERCSDLHLSDSVPFFFHSILVRVV